jgi:hypothetical protein
MQKYFPIAIQMTDIKTLGINNQRDKWLMMSDGALIKESVFGTQKRGGKGGQKVNKTSSAVRLFHAPSEISVIASESRYQKENRRIAVKKLRCVIALTIRDPSPSQEKPDKKMPHGIPSQSNHLYFLWMARLLDFFENNNYSMSKTAEDVGAGSGHLSKLLFKNGKLWKKINEERARRGMSSLTSSH